MSIVADHAQCMDCTGATAGFKAAVSIVAFLGVDTEIVFPSVLVTPSQIPPYHYFPVQVVLCNGNNGIQHTFLEFTII